ncbi:hypothetical protein PGT21_007137 [Puccinia graminis f. sp. tritici]|uniref:Uncharacterized protein n=1 Tax=Puccinia graminis f. sp. tritici TaxID=56615 RepID=A0A5B0QF96_PUCGR|nr:hypothetical protein PGT21_007137 [Puccinia graminis f. sp. tritici]KAA1123903.1 hypothetical protein PGTUg99_029179 [Puccinia graminis f. sp. tritici]
MSLPHSTDPEDLGDCLGDGPSLHCHSHSVHPHDTPQSPVIFDTLPPTHQNKNKKTTGIYVHGRVHLIRPNHNHNHSSIHPTNQKYGRYLNVAKQKKSELS